MPKSNPRRSPRRTRWQRVDHRRRLKLESLESRHLLAATLVEEVDPLNMTEFKGELYYFAGSIFDYGLYKTDGTPNSAVQIKQFADLSLYHPYSYEMIVVGNELFFTASDGTNGLELWKSDGTTSGTVMVKDINPGRFDSRPLAITNVNGTVYFSADDGVWGRELWKTDGTDEGTELVKNIFIAGQSANPQYLTALGDTVLFSADDGINGRELWKSDGTASGTQMVIDLKTTGLLTSTSPSDFYTTGDKVFFQAPLLGLYVTDGTAAGTQKFFDGSSTNFELHNGILYFTNNGLWKSDGTPNGTEHITDVFVQSEQIESAAGNVYFTTYGPTGLSTGVELWATDGSTNGTRMVTEIVQGDTSSHPRKLTEFDGKLFFTASDLTGIPGAPGVHGRELWMTDGTAQGTVLAADIYPGSNAFGTPYSSDPDELIAIGDTLYFTAYDGDSFSRSLYKFSVDRTPPSATVSTHDIMGAGGSTYTFTVTYRDQDAVVASTLDNNDVQITGPNGFSTTATLVSVDSQSDGPQRVATYRFDAPGGQWDITDSGTYTVTLLPGAVTDPSGNVTTTSSTLGTFLVAIFPEMNVTTSTGDPLLNGVSAFDLGSIQQGALGPSFSFSVGNDGDDLLLLGPLSVPNGFQIVDPLVSSLSIGQTDSVTLRLNGGLIGSWFGNVSFTTNDPDNSLFQFAVEGVVTPPPPQIVTPAQVNVPENQTDAVNVNATDAGGEVEGNGLSYSITGGADQALFNIVPDTGFLTFLSAPNFEEAGDADGNGRYEVQVTVENSLNLTDSRDFEIVVGNVNEPPRFESPTAFFANENQHTIANLDASDLDGEQEGVTLAYSVTGGADGGLFSIIPGTGELFFIATPDFESPQDADTDNVYQVEVTLTDSGQLTDVQTFSISVRDADEPPTAILLDNSQVLETSDSHSGDVPVGTLMSIDPDGDTAFTYTLVPGDGDTDNSRFRVNDNQLWIRQGTPLNAVTDPYYSIRLQSEDGTGESYQGVFEINITASPQTDFGDAPAGFPVTLASDGPRHPLGNVFLGVGIDAEPDGVASEDASSDGANDDGVVTDQ